MLILQWGLLTTGLPNLAFSLVLITLKYHSGFFFSISIIAKFNFFLNGTHLGFKQAQPKMCHSPEVGDGLKTSRLRRLQVQALPNTTPPLGKINLFTKIAITFDPMKRFRRPWLHPGRPKTLYFSSCTHIFRHFQLPRAGLEVQLSLCPSARL